MKDNLQGNTQNGGSRLNNNESSLDSTISQGQNTLDRDHFADIHGANPQAITNNKGFPDNLKTGIENLSGYAMDDVKVHFNSSKPAQLQAHAFAQGTDIHLAPGQEKHLPHEAWHVVQQKQGRVRPTMQMKDGVNVNDNAANTSSVLQGMFVDKNITFSQNAQYAIPDVSPTDLYVGHGSPQPIPQKHFDKRADIEIKVAMPASPEELRMESEGGRTDKPDVKLSFQVFSSNKDLQSPASEDQPNDCGMYANALAMDKDTWKKEKEPGEHLKGMISPQNNADQYDPNDEDTKDELSLEIGDMYRMDWDDVKNKPQEKCAHHAATVVAKDGEDHITSEAHAGRQLLKPIFHMYGTKSDTFWQANNAYFRAENQKAPFASKFRNLKNLK